LGMGARWWWFCSGVPSALDVVENTAVIARHSNPTQ